MTVAEERRSEAGLRAGLRRSGVILSIVFFALTAIAIGGSTVFLRELLTGIVCIAVAEVLMRRSKAHAPGVVAALWLGGLFSLIMALPSEGKPEGLLLFAAACAIAGARVRNPIIGAVASVFVISYFGARGWHEAALVAGIVIAAIALAMLAREWQRPSTEVLLLAMIIVAPVAGAAWSVDRTSIAWSVAYVALACAELTFAIRMRHHAAFFGAAVSVTIAAIVLRDVLPFSMEWTLIGAGALLFGVSVAISRVLRGKQSGFVVTPVRSAYEEALRVFGTVALSPRAENTAAANPQPAGGGGSFGGAGSTGDF